MASIDPIVTTRHTVSQDASESAARAASLHDCHVAIIGHSNSGE
jgi:hypothetical protein